ncbi:PilX N-terminal domain-containing pilus assembly protein [Paucibacter sp. Y2R2-4]|uniref:pilus assembly PilX family protein n=1 Tax=Paucibacter sp. Y2R2-4 TaxID=2893553 RepID=UPI00398D3D6C
MPRLRAGAHRRQTQSGAATLVVVMVLFLIMAMMAAFANRNMVFEQRIGSNYYRAGVALETAEAGADWALAMLNGDAINAACLPAGAISNSFRERYLGIVSTSRVVSPIRLDNKPVADCVRSEAQGWVCRCPAAAWTPPAAPPAAAANMQPSFQVTFPKPIVGNRPGIVRIIATGCTSSTLSDCEGVEIARDAVVGQSVVSVDAALVSALKMPPPTPLTVKGNITLDANGIGLHNSDPKTSQGLLLQTGDADIPNLQDARLESVPGTPGDLAIIKSDPQLLAADSAKMFAMFFGMSAAQYSRQPAMRQITCADDCGPTLAAAYARGVRMAWIDGPMSINTTTLLGTPTSPMLVVVNGALNIDAALQMTGLLYARGNASWSNTSGLQALLTGALVVEGDLNIAGTVDLWYRWEVMEQLKNATGSFVRVPGSWWN